jgi:hypothetical protein
MKDQQETLEQQKKKKAVLNKLKINISFKKSTLQDFYDFYIVFCF